MTDIKKSKFPEMVFFTIHPNNNTFSMTNPVNIPFSKFSPQHANLSKSPRASRRVSVMINEISVERRHYEISFHVEHVFGVMMPVVKFNYV